MKKTFQFDKYIQLWRENLRTIYHQTIHTKLAVIVFCQGEETEDLTIPLNSLDQEDSCGRILITTNINSKEDGCRTTFETNAIGKTNNSCYC